MNRNRCRALWISGMLAVVCLLVLNILVWRSRKGPRQKLILVDLPRSVSIAEPPPTSSRQHHEPRRIEAAGSPKAATKSSVQPQAQAAPHPLDSERAKSTVLLHFPEARLQAVSRPQPRTITLEPLGYVEKADGRVEAIISLGDHVHVVHEGEIIEDDFRVAKMSPAAVELVQKSAASAESPLMAQMGQGVAQAGVGKALKSLPRPVPEAVSDTAAYSQVAAGSSLSGPHPPVRQELGYVERADGGVEAIVAEGEHVRLAPATKTFASTFRVPAPSPANLEVASASPSPISPPDSFGREFQPVHTDSPTPEAGGTPPMALGSGPSNVDKPQAITASGGESEADPLGSIQPVPLADYAGSRFEVNTPQAVVATSSGTGDTPLSGGEGTESAVRTLGYVEKAGGEKQAIVEVFGQVYLVHEGELFAGKYRALQVTSSSVQIVEEPLGGSSLPCKTEWDSVAVCPPISRLRVPPLPAGSSGPPVEVPQAEESVAGKLVVRPSRPPL